MGSFKTYFKDLNCIHREGELKSFTTPTLQGGKLGTSEICVIYCLVGQLKYVFTLRWNLWCFYNYT